MAVEKSFIEIALPDAVEYGTPLILRGKFSLGYDDAGTSAQGENVLKHIILVVTRGGSYQALAPFKDLVVFPGDVKKSRTKVSGFFNFNVFEKISFGGEGTYFILCSLGKYPSNIVKVEVA